MLLCTGHSIMLCALLGWQRSAYDGCFLQTLRIQKEHYLKAKLLKGNNEITKTLLGRISCQWNKATGFGRSITIPSLKLRIFQKIIQAETMGPLIINNISDPLSPPPSSNRIQCNCPDFAPLYPTATPHGKNISQSMYLLPPALSLPCHLLYSDHILGLNWTITVEVGTVLNFDNFTSGNITSSSFKRCHRARSRIRCYRKRRWRNEGDLPRQKSTTALAAAENESPEF